MRDTIKLTRSSDKRFADLAGKLEKRDKIAYAKSKAHDGLCNAVKTDKWTFFR